jgi:hypothetical protein
MKLHQLAMLNNVNGFYIDIGTPRVRNFYESPKKVCEV